MRGNSFGNNFTVTGFGESHGPAIGAVIDGCPAGIPLTLEDFASALNRRKPGTSSITSSRQETDTPEILSGVFNGVTLGTPITVIVRNRDARPEDYSSAEFRSGHADKVWLDKYGVRDHRGGGRSSGRETITRVIGGVVAEKILPPGLCITGYTVQVGSVASEAIPEHLTREHIDEHPTRCPDNAAAERMQDNILAAKADGNSLGGVVELRIDGAPAGLGEPVFNKAKAALAYAMMSIGAVTGVTLGDAHEEVRLDGKTFHDPALSPREGISLRTHGIQGGITNGERITLRVYIKPTSTIGEAALHGRHDPCILPRVIPVLEAMAACTLADLYLTASMDKVWSKE